LSTIASTAASHSPSLNTAGGAERASRSGIWVGLFAITMSFAAFSSALFVREGTPDWGHLVLPSILYLNTLVLLLSSGTLELSRRSLAHVSAANPVMANGGIAWLLCTLLLGIAFCCGQYMAWQNLRAQGIYLATNPNSSFFYVLTFIHVLHLVAGILALLYLTARLVFRRTVFRRSLFDNTAIYWHFLGVLWVYLFLLCRMKL
jgi:cytochrome c oxidase subunit III